MATVTSKKTRPTYQAVLAAVRELTPAEQRRLRDELAALAGVQLVRPTATPAAIRRGRKLATAVRVELLQAAEVSLDEAMRNMRGRSWSL